MQENSASHAAHRCRGFVGYVWNGLVHQSKSRAVAGALVVGGLAAALHVAMPTFDAQKVALATLLDFELISDQDGTLRSTADARPSLPPFSTQATREYLGELALKYLPVTELSAEEYEKMQEKGAVRIAFRGYAPAGEVRGSMSCVLPMHMLSLEADQGPASNFQFCHAI